MTVNQEKASALADLTRAWIVKLIAEEREVFKREMRVRVGFSGEYELGDRFHSDAVVLENLMGQCGPASFGLSLGASKSLRDWAERTEIDFHADHGALMKKIWIALSQAASTDHYYEHEKGWI